MKKTTKKSRAIIGCLLSLSLCLRSLSVPCAAAEPEDEVYTDEEYTDGDYRYFLMKWQEGKVASITDYTGTETKLFIPDTLGGYPVKEIHTIFSGNNKNITEIHLPNSIDGPMNGLGGTLCSLPELSAIQVNDDNPGLASRDGVLYSKDFSTIWAYPAAKTDASYVMPDTVEHFGLSGNKFLKELTFSSNEHCTSTSEAVCFGSSLEKVIMPPNITRVDNESFENCKNLKEIQWSENTTSIGHFAFYGCSSLTDVKLPPSVVHLDAAAFAYCENLRSIELPYGLKIINSSAFLDDTALKTVTIPDSVTNIGQDAFRECPAKIKKAPYLKREAINDGGRKTYRYRAKIKAGKKGKKKTYLAKNITQFQADKDSVKLKKGTSQSLKTIVYIKEKKVGALDPSSRILSFSSDNEKVASVTKKGVVRGKKKGVANIDVTLRTTGESYPVKVRVK